MNAPAEEGAAAAARGQHPAARVSPLAVRNLTLAAFALWVLGFLCAGPRLALNHDELNFIHDSLRLVGERRLQNYARGPLQHELMAAAELGLYAVLRAKGAVRSSEDFLVHVISNEAAHLLIGRALTGAAALFALTQVYRLGALFGGPWAGALSTVLCATNLTFFALASMGKEEPLYWGLLLFASVQAWSASRAGSRGGLLLAGAAVGAAFAAKVLGVCAMVLAALPLVVGPGPLRRRLQLAGCLAAGAAASVLLLHPFLLTDTARVLANVSTVRGRLADWPGLPRLALPTYLGTHLPNMVGWTIVALGAAGLVYELRREARGPVLLLSVPVAVVLLIGLRPGQNMAHYAFPLALMALVLAAAVVVRVSALLPPPGRWLAGAAVCALIVLEPALLSGSIRHARIVLGEDTRLQARAYLESAAAPGDCILITDAIAGENFWGPPLLPLDLPEGRGAFTQALRRARAAAPGARYRLRLVGGYPAFEPTLVADCRWIVAPRFGWPQAELGTPPERPLPPAPFERVATFASTPAARAYLAPYYTSLDYEESARLPGFPLYGGSTYPWAYGWTLDIYRLPATTAGTEAPQPVEAH